MTDLFHTKRDSLERFIREQMIGPKGCRDWYTFASDDFDDSVEEVLNTTPGSIYSSAILFPKKAKEEEENTLFNQEDTKNSEEVDTEEVDTEEDASTRTDKNEESGADISDLDDEDMSSINRRFPNIMGLSCCLRGDANLNRDIKITVSGRYYTKIHAADKQKVQVRILQYVGEFKNFWADNEKLHNYYTYSDADDLLSIKNIKKDLTDVKLLLRDLNKSYAEKIAHENGIIDQVTNEQDRYLRSYRESIFNKKLSRLNNNEYISDKEKGECIAIIKKIEVFETIISYFEDLINLYDKKSYGFWISHTFSKEVPLGDIQFDCRKEKSIYRPVDYACLKDIIYVETPQKVNQGSDPSDKKFLSLSLWLQINRNGKDKQDDRIYLKTSLENTSSPFAESAQNYFSIVTEGVNRYCFFGVKIEIESEKIEPYRANHQYNDVNKEDDNLNFLYKDICDYAIGHFCSADWPDDEKIRKVFTEFLPSYETPDIEPIPRNKYGDYIEDNGVLVPEPYLIANDCLQFKWLSTFSANEDEKIICELTSFVNTYEKWINQMRDLAGKAEDSTFANANLEACYIDCRRMMANIEGILTQEAHMKTFRMMNSAMFMQLWHSVGKNQKHLTESREETNESFYKKASDFIFLEGQHAAWRPFQLAFILLNLDGIIRHPDDHDWSHRNEIVDLVWFPTGGGKTEAYLGLIALCIIHRRCNYGSKGFGVTAIMRYTLRLLTTQQFQRALRLILALEEMRTWDDVSIMGEKPISIGLYVGANSLPNSLKALKEEAAKWYQNQRGEKNNTKIPLDKCPWCGTKLSYQEDEGFYCLNDKCTFCDSHLLPVMLCDEQIYSDPPTLLFGTVDKFAAIAHKVTSDEKNKKSDSRRIFGKGVGLNYLPPDLIIQDELHLLLGPLGSAVSLFECAIDQLCSREENIEGRQLVLRPKIISSTATTRNTGLQIRALYDRDVNIFPKNGITFDDSFFSFYKRKKNGDKVSYVSKRKYLGILPTGRTQMTTQMRLAAILLVHRAMFEECHNQESDFEKVANNYYSVISYFNSLRELGKTDAQFYTEYSKYVKRLYRRVMRFGNLLECFYAMGELNKSELSGRLTGSEVNERFTEVGKCWTTDGRLPHKKHNSTNAEWERGSTPPDYILATNMISVGLDVDRFNTIIMNSMPRNIAEYIQASSRVARNTIGMVLTLHNPFRSRDISHFERFREFHEKLYYYVEPISITPFSHKSIDKYLPLYMAAVIRHSFEELASNGNASNITKDGLSCKVKEKIFSYFQEKYNRLKNVKEELQKGLLTKELHQYLGEVVGKAMEQWYRLAYDSENIIYDKNYNRSDGKPALFTSPEDYDETRNLSLWSVPMSLRVVEPEAVLHIEISNADNKKRSIKPRRK